MTEIVPLSFAFRPASLKLSLQLLYYIYLLISVDFTLQNRDSAIERVRIELKRHYVVPVIVHLCVCFKVFSFHIKKQG